MKQEEKPIILSDSPEAAQKVIITTESGEKYGSGWVSANRRFYPTESQARNDGATHHKCETCGSVNKVGSYCSPCYSKKRSEKYLSMPYQEWDGKTMLVIFDDDRFFDDEGDVRDYCENNEIKVSELQLVVCEPNRMDTIGAEHWADIMPEDGDGDLPKEVEEALIVFNAVIEKQGPISWGAGKFRTSFPDVEENSGPSDERNTSNDDFHEAAKP